MTKAQVANLRTFRIEPCVFICMLICWDRRLSRLQMNDHSEGSVERGKNRKRRERTHQESEGRHGRATGSAINLRRIAPRTDVACEEAAVAVGAAAAETRRLRRCGCCVQTFPHSLFALRPPSTNFFLRNAALRKNARPVGATLRVFPLFPPGSTSCVRLQAADALLSLAASLRLSYQCMARNYSPAARHRLHVPRLGGSF